MTDDFFYWDRKSANQGTKEYIHEWMQLRLVELVCLFSLKTGPHSFGDAGFKGIRLRHD